MKGLIICTSLLFSLYSYAARLSNPHLPIGHCYHWLWQNEEYPFLDFKYQHALKNKGEVNFITKDETTHGELAGKGLYCAKSAIETYAFGNRAMRIELVDDVVIYDAVESKKNICGHDGKFFDQNECDKKKPDVVFYQGGKQNGYAYYVIRNPMAIKAWTANSQQLIKEIREALPDLRYAQQDLKPFFELAETYQIAREFLDSSISYIEEEQRAHKDIFFVVDSPRLGHKSDKEILDLIKRHNLKLFQQLSSRISSPLSLKISGAVNMVPFTFAGLNSAEIENQCQEYKKMPVSGLKKSLGGITFRINSGRLELESLNSLDLCKVIKEIANRNFPAHYAKNQFLKFGFKNQNPISPLSSLQLTGSWGRVSFSFVNMREFRERCKIFYDSIDKSIFDYMTISAADTSEKVALRTFRMETADDFCRSFENKYYQIAGRSKLISELK